MKYDFDAVVERKGTDSLKWESNLAEYNREGMIPLWVADMDFTCLPEITEALNRRVAHPIYGYGIRPDAFFDSLKDWIRRRFQVEVETSWLTSIAGVVPAMHVAIDAFTSPGDKIVIQPPVYHPFFWAVEHRGRQVLENRLVEQAGRFSIDWDDLEAKLQDPQAKLMLLCSPHNPVGRVWTREELVRLGELCVKHGVLVISDEIHADLVFEKGTHTPYYSLPAELANQSVTLLAASKTFNLAGLFTSFALTPNSDLLRTFKATAAQMGHELVNIFGIEATIAAYQHGESWLDQLLVYLYDNARYIQQFLEQRLPEISMQVPEATYLGWMDFRQLNLPQKELLALIQQKARLGLQDGMIFGEAGAGYCRINFACPRALLVEAMERLEQAVREHVQQSR